MKKWIGYLISVIGILIMVIGFGTLSVNLPLLNSLDQKIITALGIGLVIVGVVFSMMDKNGPKKGKSKRIAHAKDEVPIYEGEGKKRRIVGYRKD